MTTVSPSSAQTSAARNYHEGPTETLPEVSLRFRYFTQETRAGLVSGVDASIVFVIDRPARAIWSHFKDFTSWQPGHYYSGVVGDLEGQPFRLGTKPNDPAAYTPHPYQVLKVIPEHTIVIAQPADAHQNGGVSRGFHVFLLNEQAERTTFNILLEHATCTTDKTVDEALAYWGDPKMAPAWLRKWRDDFIPALKKLVAAGGSLGRRG